MEREIFAECMPTAQDLCSDQRALMGLTGSLERRGFWLPGVLQATMATTEEAEYLPHRNMSSSETNGEEKEVSGQFFSIIAVFVSKVCPCFVSTEKMTVMCIHLFYKCWRTHRVSGTVLGNTLRGFHEILLLLDNIFSL